MMPDPENLEPMSHVNPSYTGDPATHPQEPSLGTLVSDLTSQIPELIRSWGTGMAQRASSVRIASRFACIRSGAMPRIRALSNSAIESNRRVRK